MMRPIEVEFERSASHCHSAAFIKTLVSKRTVALPTDLDYWSVQSKNGAQAEADGQITATEYATLQDAFDFLNYALFSRGLPQVLITLQRHPSARGYFSAKRFQNRGNTATRVHEIALNPDTFAGATDKAILATLAHEMVHLWQEEFGEPGRGRYHNREWALKMHSIGLMPSSTGRPGGDVTGDRVSHYILTCEAFDVASDAFLIRYALKWQSALPDLPAGNASGDDDPPEGGKPPSDNEPEVVESKRQTRVKYTCPICGLNVWAKPGALIDCHQCSKEANEQILMRPAESKAKASVARVAEFPK